MKTAVLRGGRPVHPLVYSKRVLRMDRGVEDGQIVRVLAREGDACGYAFAHTQSMIALRMLSFDPGQAPDEGWLAARLAAAERLRTDVLRIPRDSNAWRSVHAEADALSGLVIDRYDDVAVLLFYSRGWYEWRDALIRIVKETLGVETVLWRVDTKTATHEGIPEAPAHDPVLREIHEYGLRVRVDAASGHKSGWFLDQRENRRTVRDLAPGRRVFDGMSYAGGFALAAAAGGAQHVVGMDLDEEAIRQAQANARLGEHDIDFRHGDVFDALRAFGAGPEEDRPDLLIIDPPKWVRDRKGLGVAIARYGDLNRLAIDAVQPGGLVFTHSCSGLISEESFLSILKNAALDARRHVRVLRISGAAPDHPVALHAPEGRYLKSVLLAVDGPGSGPQGSGRNDSMPEADREERPGRPRYGERGPHRDGPRRDGPRRDGPRRGGPRR